MKNAVPLLIVALMALVVLWPVDGDTPGPGPKPAPSGDAAKVARAYLQRYGSNLDTGFTAVASQARTGQYSGSMELAKELSEMTNAARSEASKATVDKALADLFEATDDSPPKVADWLEEFGHEMRRATQ